MFILDFFNQNAGMVSSFFTTILSTAVIIWQCKNKFVIEELKNLSNEKIKDKEQFFNMAINEYSEIFASKIAVYKKLASIKNAYIAMKYENFLTDEGGSSSSAYMAIYRDLRNCILERKLSISTELDEAFTRLCIEMAPGINEEELFCASKEDILDKNIFNTERGKIRDEIQSGTSYFMDRVMTIIDRDVSCIREKIDK